MSSGSQLIVHRIFHQIIIYSIKLWRFIEGPRLEVWGVAAGQGGAQDGRVVRCTRTHLLSAWYLKVDNSFIPCVLTDFYLIHDGSSLDIKSKHLQRADAGVGLKSYSTGTKFRGKHGLGIWRRLFFRLSRLNILLLIDILQITGVCECSYYLIRKPFCLLHLGKFLKMTDWLLLFLALQLFAMSLLVRLLLPKHTPNFWNIY